MTEEEKPEGQGKNRSGGRPRKEKPSSREVFYIDEDLLKEMEKKRGETAKSTYVSQAIKLKMESKEDDGWFGRKSAVEFFAYFMMVNQNVAGRARPCALDFVHPIHELDGDGVVRINDITHRELANRVVESLDFMYTTYGVPPDRHGPGRWVCQMLKIAIKGYDSQYLESLLSKRWLTYIRDVDV